MLSKIDKLSSATRGPGRWPRWRGLDPTVQQMDGCWQAGSTVYRTVGCAGSDLDPIVSRSKHRANTTHVPYRLNRKKLRHSKEMHDFAVAGTVAGPYDVPLPRARARQGTRTRQPGGSPTGRCAAVVKYE